MQPYSDEVILNPEDKLLQNIQALIGEIGEKQVLLRLFLLIQGTCWQLYHNLGEEGYGLLLLNQETRETIYVDVKTRRSPSNSIKLRRRIKFSLTDEDYKNCDFLVAYLIDTNGFYIVPRADLEEVYVGSTRRWRFVLEMDENGEPLPHCARYRDAWHTLHEDFMRRRLDFKYFDEEHDDED